MMATQGEALAARVDLLTQEIAGVIDGCSEQQWQKACAGEGWSVGVTAHHLAGGISPTAGLVQAVATGQPLPPLTAEIIDADNAVHAQQFASCTKAETLALLKSNGAAAASMVRSLSDAQLGRTASFALLGDTPVSAAQAAEGALLGHAQAHLTSLRATL